MGVSRLPRIEVAGGIYHVVARGNERRLVFRDDVDRERFLEILGLVVDRRPLHRAQPCSCWARPSVDGWRWTSHAATIGTSRAGVVDVAGVLSLFGANARAARDAISIS